jgi:hypothetical protein
MAYLIPEAEAMRSHIATSVPISADTTGRARLGDGAVTAVKLDQQIERHVDKTISTAQVLALNATPIALVAAPGAGFALVFEGAVIHKPAGTAYGGVAAGEDLGIKYTDGSGLEVAACEMTGFADQATAQTRFIRPRTGALAAGTVSDLVVVANAALVAHMLVGEIITGTSAFIVRVFYRVIPTVLT